VILLVSATRAELHRFSAPPEVRWISSGIGPVEAALATARAIVEMRPSLVLNAGIAGAFRGAAVPGEVVAVGHETLVELALEGGGEPDLPEGLRLEREASSDPALLKTAAAAGLRSARGITVATITATGARAAALRQSAGADVESMEGFAVLRAAALAGVPAIEIRGISNYVGDRASSEWDFEAGARATARGLAAFFGALEV
jgi:futalosine hydrolase